MKGVGPSADLSIVMPVFQDGEVVDSMVALARDGADVVSASRCVQGGQLREEVQAKRL